METVLLPILLFAGVAALVAIGMLVLGQAFGPKRSSAVKEMPYESGMDPVHDTRRRFDVRFHLVAICFLIFDVELLFLYPWAVASKDEAGVTAALVASIESAGGGEFHGSFQVARYERPRLSLLAELTRPVVYRGEKIEGKFKLRYFFGEPAVGKPIEYRMALPDGSVVERRGVTNAAGEVPFSLETTEFGEEALAQVQARVVAENVSTQVVVPVVTTEFAPAVSMVRSVYLSGEPFDVRIEIADRSGKALGRKGVVRLLRYEAKGKGKHLVEVEVSKQEFETSSSDGVASVTFRAQKGGAHVVRVEAEDRFGTLVTGEARLMI